MKAIFTTVCWAEVEDADEAAEKVAEIDEVSRRNIIVLLERGGHAIEDVQGLAGFMGSSFWLIDEERVLG